MSESCSPCAATRFSTFDTESVHVDSAAYFVFSVGNLTPVFEEEYPRCWKTHETCSKALLSSIHYTQVPADAGCVTAAD